MRDLPVVQARDQLDLLRPAVAGAAHPADQARVNGPIIRVQSLSDRWLTGAQVADDAAAGRRRRDQRGGPSARESTAAFCERYGVDQAEFEQNYVVVDERRGGETRSAACICWPPPGPTSTAPPGANWTSQGVVRGDERRCADRMESADHPVGLPRRGRSW